MERKMYNTNNFVRMYEVSKFGDVDVVIIGLMPYPGFWQFGISAKECEFGTEKFEEKLKELLEKAFDNEDWTLRGCSTSCEWNELLSELEKKYELREDEKEAIIYLIEKNK